LLCRAIESVQSQEYSEELRGVIELLAKLARPVIGLSDLRCRLSSVGVERCGKGKLEAQFSLIAVSTGLHRFDDF
jgi:hypothetical protein